MVIHEHNADQQIHEEVGPHKKKDNCKDEKQKLVIVKHWPLNNIFFTVSLASMKVYT